MVVQKIDHLTRSLMDFSRIVEIFDRHEVSFVSFTQQFNTSTSKGRPTLNMLLSFARFEGEVTAERRRGVEGKLVLTADPQSTSSPDPGLIRLITQAHHFLGQLTNGEARSIINLAAITGTKLPRSATSCPSLSWLRIFTIVDRFTREVARVNSRASQVIDELDRLARIRGKPTVFELTPDRSSLGDCSTSGPI